LDLVQPRPVRIQEPVRGSATPASRFRSPTSSRTTGSRRSGPSRPGGDSPPLHVHRTEDELFHVLDGMLTLRVGDDLIELAAGATALAPKAVPHTYRVDSPTARWLV